MVLQKSLTGSKIIMPDTRAEINKLTGDRPRITHEDGTEEPVVVLFFLKQSYIYKRGEKVWQK